MGVLARISSEIAYLRGLRRTLRRNDAVVLRPDHTIGEEADDLAARYGDRPALISERETLTYRQWNAHANQYARWARAQGFVKGDVVCLMMPNRPEYLSVWVGLAKAGVVAALINTNLIGVALAHSVNVVGARAVIVDGELAAQFDTARALLDPTPRIVLHGAAATESADERLDLATQALDDSNLAPAERGGVALPDPAVLIYTSGTTGLPKAARWTHLRLMRAMHGFSGVVNATAEDRIYDALPMYHSNGGMLAPGIVLTVGGSIFIREKFSAREFWPEIARQNCTMFIYIGELCRYLVSAPPGPFDRAHRVRVCVGNGLRPDVWPAFAERFGVPEIVEFYAATEGNVVLFNFDSTPGSIGRIPGWAASRLPIKIIAYDAEQGSEVRNGAGRCVECAVDEIGEAIGEIREGPKSEATRFDGYQDPVATKAKILRDVFREGDVWFRTGDLMRRDSRGYFYFIDRIGDTFRWKGENVSTTEVEQAISAYPGVAEANVYGVAIPGQEGRAGMAAIALSEGAAFDLDGLRAHLEGRLPSYARPLFIRLREALDHTGTFKLKKVDLAADGFDPARSSDAMYFDDRSKGGYRRVDVGLAQALRTGAMKV
jgi:fatty-acyl-CoA synthase